MKNPASSRLLLAAVLATVGATSAFATPPEKPAFTHQVSMVDHLGNSIARGSGMSDVLMTLGMPSHKLTANVWAYANFNGGPAQHRDDDCSTLLLTFTRGWVSNIQLVNDHAEKIYAAQLRAPAPGRLQVAAK